MTVGVTQDSAESLRQTIGPWSFVMVMIVIGHDVRSRYGREGRDRGCCQVRSLPNRSITGQSTVATAVVGSAQFPVCCGDSE